MMTVNTRMSREDSLVSARQMIDYRRMRARTLAASRERTGASLTGAGIVGIMPGNQGIEGFRELMQAVQVRRGQRAQYAVTRRRKADPDYPAVVGVG